jgi:hypothetical protein
MHGLFIEKCDEITADEVAFLREPVFGLEDVYWNN